MKCYITFGQVHVHRVNGKTFDRDSVAVIECTDEEDGRKKAFQYFDDKWHECIPENKFDPIIMNYFPRGLIEVETEEFQGRGVLTTRVKNKAKELLGYEITVTELRLMPYIQYTMMNNQRLSLAHINRDDREILHKWREAGHIEGGMSGLRITKDFWDKINEILFLAYVDLDGYHDPITPEYQL